MVATAVLTLTLFVGATLAAPRTPRLERAAVTSTSVHPSIAQMDWFEFGAWYQVCGANIVSNIVVLSAARCTHPTFDPDYRPSTRRIRAGADYRHKGGQLVYVHSVLNHPNFNVQTLDSDISIVRLSSPLIFGDNIRSISIMPQNFNIPDNSVVIYAGWFGNHMNISTSEVVLAARGLTLNYKDCDRRLEWRNTTETQFCTLNIGGEESCIGDVGGPTYFVQQNNQNILAGVMTFGACSCLDPNDPSISARTASFSNWIVANA